MGLGLIFGGRGWPQGHSDETNQWREWAIWLCRAK
jgi:hypothetical protein